MPGVSRWDRSEVLFVLDRVIERKSGPVIRAEFEAKYKKKLTSNQVRYLKTKYGHDPEFK